MRVGLKRASSGLSWQRISARLAALTALIACTAAPQQAWTQEVLSDNALTTLKWVGLFIVSLLIGLIVIMARMLREQTRRQSRTNQAPRTYGSAAAAWKALKMVRRTAGSSRQLDSHGGESADVRQNQTFVARPEQDQTQPVALPQKQSGQLDTTISFKVCQSCAAIFDIGAEHCPFDGARLHLSNDEQVLDLIGPVECPSCMEVFEAGSIYCPNDGETLETQALSKQSFVPVGVALCTQCHREFAQSSTHCPHDGAVLVPLHGRRTCGLSFEGEGPKTQICPECGTPHSRSATYCGWDGQRLVNLN